MMLSPNDRVLHRTWRLGPRPGRCSLVSSMAQLTVRGVSLKNGCTGSAMPRKPRGLPGRRVRHDLRVGVDGVVLRGLSSVIHRRAIDRAPTAVLETVLPSRFVLTSNQCSGPARRHAALQPAQQPTKGFGRLKSS